ncbi:hypothetical protein DSO57_1023857 [Entomophthora muscae]|uniref:Uncharacterized protein n=1 Tax=Entomophthora muscae TaxID=34485 RepID=A0ACC2S4T3_9FUNG|nr:hypothetical protein DSO57_1023857 [Entomophthora muscae]
MSSIPGDLAWVHLGRPYPFLLDLGLLPSLMESTGAIGAFEHKLLGSTINKTEGKLRRGGYSIGIHMGDYIVLGGKPHTSHAPHNSHGAFWGSRCQIPLQHDRWTGVLLITPHPENFVGDGFSGREQL